jgi:hypothetical protein
MKKILLVVVVLLFVSVLFVGCSGGNSGSNPKNEPKVASLEVHVTDQSGDAVSEASVLMEDLNKLTNSEGKVTFENVKPGTYKITARKDDFEDQTKIVNVEAGNNKTVVLSINKKENKIGATEIESLSKTKSYKLVAEMLEDGKSNGKFVVFSDNYGKDQHFLVYNDKGGVELEVVMVNDKARVKSGDNGKWMDMPATAVKAMTNATIGMAENAVNGLVTEFNEVVKDSKGTVTYSIKKMGTETVNGYSTVKYRFSGEGSTQEESGKVTADMWIVNSGKFKGYMTLVEIKSMSNNEKPAEMKINITDIGNDMHISMP